MKLTCTIEGPTETLQVIRQMFETQFDLLKQGECLARKRDSNGNDVTFKIPPIKSFDWNMSE